MFGFREDRGANSNDEKGGISWPILAERARLDDRPRKQPSLMSRPYDDSEHRGNFTIDSRHPA